MTVLEAIDSLTSEPFSDFDLNPNLLEEFPEYKNVFKYLHTKPMDVFLTYRVGDKPNEIYYFDLSSQKAQEKYLDLLKQDNVSFDTLKKELSYVELDRFPHNFRDAVALEDCLTNGDLTPEQCCEDFMEDYDFNKGYVKSFYALTKLKECLKNDLWEIEDEEDNYLSFSSKKGNGLILDFDFDIKQDIYTQFNKFTSELNYDDMFSKVYEFESGYENNPDVSNCESLAKGYINSLKNINDQFQKTDSVKQEIITTSKSRGR